MNIKTYKDSDGIIYHEFNGISIECSGGDCQHCKRDTDISFKTWESSVPYPIPPKGKRYRRPSMQKNRGKTIAEICGTCKEIPCYICRRIKCDQWMKESQRKGQAQGCVFLEVDRCTEFSCELGLIKTRWRSDEEGLQRKN
jgi:hypothetical protein